MRESVVPQSKSSLWVMVALGVLVVVAGGAFWALNSGVGPPPVDIASDPLLVQGREIFLSRCASCHGPTGRGDGVLSKDLTGPKPRDFVADEWKYGTAPAQVVKVIAEGVPGTSMGAWKMTYSPEEIRGVAAYTYHLAGRPVPEVLRSK